MRAHEWLGVEHVRAPRAERRPLAYVGGAAVALLVVLYVIRAAPSDTVTAELDVTSAAPPRPAIALEQPTVVAVAVQPAPAARVAISMALGEAGPQASGLRPRGPDPEEETTGHVAAIEHAQHAGILGAPGLGAAITRVAGHSDIAGGMSAVTEQAIASGWTPVTDGMPADSFGQDAKKRDCPIGEHKDPTLDKCVPDSP